MAPQAVIYASGALPFAALWLAAVSEWFPILDYAPESSRHLVVFAPIYVLVFLGIYAMCSVLYGVATFNGCPQARAELVTEIDEAKAELRRRKVIN